VYTGSSTEFSTSAFLPNTYRFVKFQHWTLNVFCIGQVYDCIFSSFLWFFAPSLLFLPQTGPGGVGVNAFHNKHIFTTAAEIWQATPSHFFHIAYYAMYTLPTIFTLFTTSNTQTIISCFTIVFVRFVVHLISTTPACASFSVIKWLTDWLETQKMTFILLLLHKSIKTCNNRDHTSHFHPIQWTQHLYLFNTQPAMTSWYINSYKTSSYRKK